MNENGWFYRFAARSLWCMLGFIFLLVGLGLFIGFALDGMPPRSLAAALLVLAGLLCYGADAVRRRRSDAIRREGVEAEGVVEKVVLHRGVKVKTKVLNLTGRSALHPYTVHFRYSCGGREYQGRSEWFWEKPRWQPGDRCRVLTAPACPARSVGPV